ncbi:MAG: PKD domain-containing protein [Candidatus Cyclobacteriaceae bacterium M3_2C_046]
MKIFLLAFLTCLGLSNFYTASCSCPAEIVFKQNFNKAVPALPAQKCVKIDISQSYDQSENGLIYRWNMGDGHISNGMKISHCYEQYGEYQASLDVIIQENNDIIVSKNEMVLDLVIKEDVQLQLDGDSANFIKETSSFNYQLSPLITYKKADVYWDMGDGSFFCQTDNNISHTYAIPGIYLVRILIELNNKEGKFFIRSQKNIHITGFNLFGSEFIDKFEKAAQSRSNPFLSDPVFLMVTDQEKKEVIKHLELNKSDSICLILPENNFYLLQIWQNNKFLPPVPFSTRNKSDSHATFKLVEDAVKQLLNQEPVDLKPIEFDYNQTRLNAQNKRLLKKTLDLLENIQPAGLKIGTFTHTGGALNINLKTSLQRSLAVKSYLQKEAKEEILIDVADPQQDTSLINTCVEVESSIQENPEFNRKAYIKLILPNEI